MAFIETIQFNEETTSEFFMVSDSVGANAANWWTDIQLVQYLIGSIYLYAKTGSIEWEQKMTEAELNALPNPHTDFKKLGKTAELIKRFQDDAVKQGMPVVSDGRIDRARGLTASISKTRYTIHIANYFFGDAVTQSEGAENWVEWALDSYDMPDMLKGQLRTRLEL